MSALNPVHRIGKQLVESLRLHEKMSARAALQKSIELLDYGGNSGAGETNFELSAISCREGCGSG